MAFVFLIDSKLGCILNSIKLDCKSLASYKFNILSCVGICVFFGYHSPNVKVWNRRSNGIIITNLAS